MLTKITIRNFKLFEEVEIPLGNGFVFIGPNNGGKTSALQALTLWYTGLQKWADKHASKDQEKIPTKRPGVTVNRLDLIPLPIVEVDLIWFKRKVRRGPNENIRIDLVVEGISQGKEWNCGLEFDYANTEALFCRPLRTGSGNKPERMEVPREALDTKLTFLPPMSGLATEEALIQEGRINVLVGQGQTAEVLRNLCYRVYSKDDKTDWNSLVAHFKNLFGVTLNEPQSLLHRGTITMDYCDQDGKTTLDLSSSGRGMQQVLLLLAHLYDNSENTVFLLDEPDAHLEILRQRQIYNRINEVAEKRNSQIISASHSEVLLGEAAQRESAVAFVGNPHILGENKQSRVMSALKDIGFEFYYEAERKGWILYLEGETDLRILQAFAQKLEHPSEQILQDPLVKYIANLPNKAREHFHALKEAKNDLQGILLLDRTEKELRIAEHLLECMWEKYEIENYLCKGAAIIAYVTDGFDSGDLFGNFEISKRKNQIKEEISKLEQAFKTLNKPGPFSDDIKASDDFLVPLFENFAVSLGKPKSIFLQKKDFYKLVPYIPRDEIDAEVEEKLNAIVKVAEKAQPKTV